jgi:hypothetical protein
VVKMIMMMMKMVTTMILTDGDKNDDGWIQ